MIMLAQITVFAQLRLAFNFIMLSIHASASVTDYGLPCLQVIFK